MGGVVNRLSILGAAISFLLVASAGLAQGELGREIYLVVSGESFNAIERGVGSLGSAIAVATHWALTNCHVVGGAKSVIALIGEEHEQVLVAAVARADAATDRCFLRTEGILKPIAGIRRFDGLAVGERVYTIGNPSGLSKTLGELG